MDFSKLSKYLLFLFLFLLPLQTAYLVREVFVGGEKWQYGTIALYVSDIVLLMALIVALLGWIRNYIRMNNDSRFRNYEKENESSLFSILTSSIINHKSIAALAMLVLWSGLSVLWASDQTLAAYMAVELALAAGAFVLIRLLDDDEAKTAIKILVIGAMLQGFLGVWQFLSQSTFASALLGMSAHEVAAAGTSVLKGWHIRWLRAYGTLPHPNILGGFLSTALVLGVGYQAFQVKISDAARLPDGQGCKISDGKRNFISLIAYPLSLIFYPLSLILILLGLIMTFSRSAWLGAALGIVSLAVSYFFQSKSAESECNIIRRPSDYVTFWKTLVVLGVAGMVFVGVLHETILPRFDGVIIENEGSVSDRVQSLLDAGRVIGEGNMLLGTGIGNSTAAAMRIMPDRPVWTVQPVHDVFVLVFAELGLVGFVLFVGFLGSLLAPILKSSIINHQSAIVVTLLPISLLDHYLWSSHFGLLLFFILLGFAARK